jgi:hypothetical protein
MAVANMDERVALESQQVLLWMVLSLTVAEDVAGLKPVEYPTRMQNAAHQVMVSGIFTAKLSPKCLLAFVGCRLVSLSLPRPLIAIRSLTKQCM